MSHQQSTIPTPKQTSPLRVLGGCACRAVIVGGVGVTAVAFSLCGMPGYVEGAVDDASRSARRLDTRSRDLQPTIRELRDAAESLQNLNPGATP